PATGGTATTKAAAAPAESAAAKASTTATPAQQGTQQGAGQHRASLAAPRPTAGDADHQEHHGEHDEKDQQRWLLRRGASAESRQIALHGLTTDHLDHALDAGANAAGKIPLAEGGGNQVVNDQRALRIGQPILQAIADLDADAPFGLGHDQQGAVVLALLADAPLAAQGQAGFLDAASAQIRQGDHHQLVAGGLLMTGQQLGEFALLGGIEQLRPIHHPTG